MSQGSPAFIAAVKAGDFETVRAMLEAQPTLVDSRDANGATAVQTAVYNFQRPIAEHLVQAGADLDLASACCVGRADRVRAVANKDNVNVLTDDGFCPLALAAAFGGPETTRAVLDAGADVNLRSRALGGVAAVHACVFGRNNDVLKALIDAGADVNLRQEGGFTPLMGAAQNGDPVAVRLLLDAGADPGAASDDGKTVGQWAKESGNAEVQALLP